MDPNLVRPATLDEIVEQRVELCITTLTATDLAGELLHRPHLVLGFLHGNAVLLAMELENELDRLGWFNVVSAALLNATSPTWSELPCDHL